MVKTLLFVLRAWDTSYKNNIWSGTTYIINSSLGMENARIPILLIGLSERILLGNGIFMTITTIPIAVINDENKRQR